MLIPSHRIHAADHDTWKTRERYDAKLAKSPHLERLETEAVNELKQFFTDHPDAFGSMSWGKDSVVVAHLISLVHPDAVLKRARVKDWEPPETDWVRDHFLDAHPKIQYEEHIYDGRVPQRGEPGFEEVHQDPNRKATNIMSKLIPGKYISGVRAEESAMRRQSLKWHGIATNITCRPIIKWAATDVFAYLHRHQLPVHPTYAMTYGDMLDRRWLRVHILGSTKAARSAVYGREMDSWEEDYYGDILTQARQNRAHLFKGPS